jgi:hypothetical protein
VEYNYIVVPVEMAEATEARVKWAVEPYMDPNEVAKKSVWHTITLPGEGEKEVEYIAFSYPVLPAHDVEIRRRLGHPEGSLKFSIVFQSLKGLWQFLTDRTFLLHQTPYFLIKA